MSLLLYRTVLSLTSVSLPCRGLRISSASIQTSWYRRAVLEPRQLVSVEAWRGRDITFTDSRYDAVSQLVLPEDEFPIALLTVWIRRGGGL
jgi:hypothetical protein